MILFLDFDGVSHPEPCRPDEEFSTLRLIEDVLQEFPGVEIVISSSWREHFLIEEIRAKFSADIGSRIVGFTPVVRKLTERWTPPCADAVREAEVLIWMKANRPWGTPWLAIDDRPRWFTPECRNLLVTDRKWGFRFDQVDDLRRMISERLETT
jgi:hypothetical protein